MSEKLFQNSNNEIPKRNSNKINILKRKGKKIAFSDNYGNALIFVHTVLSRDFRKKRKLREALVAQWLEHWSYEPGVTGSNPVLSRLLNLLPGRARQFCKNVP